MTETNGNTVEQHVRPANMPDDAEHLIDDIWGWPNDRLVYVAHENFVNLQESKYGIGETFDEAIVDLQKDESTVTEPNEATAGLLSEYLDQTSLDNNPVDMKKIIEKINEIISFVTN